MKPMDVSALTEVKENYAGMSYEQARHRELQALARRFEAPMRALMSLRMSASGHLPAAAIPTASCDFLTPRTA
jgi:hypothetical protein